MGQSAIPTEQNIPHLVLAENQTDLATVDLVLTENQADLVMVDSVLAENQADLPMVDLVLAPLPSQSQSGIIKPGMSQSQSGMNSDAVYSMPNQPTQIHQSYPTPDGYVTFEFMPPCTCGII
jgi:hypothetical protein